jgi:hypothetical protein
LEDFLIAVHAKGDSFICILGIEKWHEFTYDGGVIKGLGNFPWVTCLFKIGLFSSVG